MSGSRTLAPALAGTLALAGITVLAAGAADLRRLFPREADVVVERDGLSRLVLPSEVVAACRPDLSDLRLFDARGKETAFLVDRGAAPDGTLEVAQRYDPRVLDVAREETRREDRPALRRETYEIDLPERTPGSGAWVLVVQTRPAEFVARVRIEGVGTGAGTTTLVEAGSLFRLRGPRPVENLRLPLPPFAGRRVRVMLESEHSSWIDPAFRLESARALERGDRIAVPLETLAIRGSEGRTVADLLRPPGIVPDLMRVETSTGTFDRKVEVWDEGPTRHEAALGSGRIFRVEAFVPVGEQEVQVGAARGERLRVEIEDGDSPQLADLAFAAIVRQPSLIFTLPPGPSGGAAGVLRFGGGRAHRPRYDLEGLLPRQAQGVAGKRAEAIALLHDPAVVRPARLGAARPNPDYDGTPVLAFAMHPGAEVDRRIFSHRRPITVPSAPEGLSRLRLQAGDLAVLADDLADLRVADATGRQWPYLIAREAATDLLPLAIEGPERRDGASRYLVRPPVAPLRFDRVLLDATAGYFDRAFRIEVEVEGGGTRTLASGRLARPIGDPRPVTLTVDPWRLESLSLVIEDGDDAPLQFRSIRARVLLPEIYLTAPAGRYTLLMGAPGQDAPRYELERVREVVLAVQAAPIDAGALEPNSEFSLKARLAGQGERQTVLLWASLIAAVVILALLTLRLARREPSGSA